MPRRNKQIKHIRTTSKNACESKRRFERKSETEKAADYQMLLDNSLQLSVYQCNICNKWHLTSTRSIATN